MKNVFLYLLLFVSLSLFSQGFEVPKDYKLVLKEDYAPYNDDIIKCADWLINTPYSQDKTKRVAASEFLMKWVNGSPEVHMVLRSELLKFVSADSHLLVIFIGGWAKQTIQSANFKNTVAKANSDKDGMVAGNVAGIEAVIAFYNLNKDILGKNKEIEKLIKLKEKGELTEFVEKIVKS